VPASEPIDTHQKALSINLDPSVFGSFAEIGAGQEVARWFLQVGAASGTVAKTISAYDKDVSDELYGAGTRYVSQPRLQSMLEHEWSHLLAQLNEHRGDSTRFFCFVDTVSARNFAGDNECHGWVGLRFQAKLHGPPNDIILHINLRDRSNLAQQAAVGILGVNLIYAAFHHLGSVEEFLGQLAADLPVQRVEFDFIAVRGEVLSQWNADHVHASLVAKHLAEAVVFPAGDKLAPPTVLLYKKAMVMAPGEFGAIKASHAKMLEDTLASLGEEDLAQAKGSIGLFALTCVGGDTGGLTLSAEQILEHVQAAQKLGYGLLVFHDRELYKMGAFVNRFTKAPVHFAIEFSMTFRAMQENYKELDGALLEGLARLFRENVRLSVFPIRAATMKDRFAAAGWKWTETNGLVGANNVEPPEPLNHLYRYLIGSGFIVPKKLDGL